ncbi:MAG: 2Fe-2S iron-sulfur cluster binding domain-containing protein [Polyangiaceae bacterium]
MNRALDAAARLRTIEFEGQRYTLGEAESVLECLLRHGLSIPNFCRSGVCQACMLKATSGEVPAASQRGIKPSLQQLEHFLACMCRPAGDLAVARCEAAERHPSRVTRVEHAAPRVLRVWLERPPGLEFRAGQFVQLERPSDALLRPYSLASLPDDDELELHVALLEHGAMSSWLQGAVGHAVWVRGAFGDCFYQEGESERPLLLAGTGTGLAPLFAVLRAAARAAHRGPITLCHGSRAASGLDLRRQLSALQATLPSLSLLGSVLDGDPAALASHGSDAWQLTNRPLDELLAAHFPSLQGFRVYLCGNPGLVQRLKTRAYLAGAALERIHSDPFISAPTAVG